MFSYKGKTRDTWETSLESYFKRDDTWDHAVYMFPIISRPRLSKSDDTLKNHIWWCLKEWSALRGNIKFKTIHKNYNNKLDRFCSEIEKQSCNKLSLIDSDQVEKVAEKFSEIIYKYSKSIKGSSSPVFGSKLGHFLFLPLIPVYDIQVIETDVLPNLFGKRKMKKDYKTYFLLCWWVIQEMKKSKSLESCLKMYKEFLEKQWKKKLLTQDWPCPSNKDWEKLPPESSIAELALISASYPGGIRLKLASD